MDTSKKMSGIFSLDAMMEATKGKEAYWVLAVPEVAACLCDNAGALWNSDPMKNASVVVCSGAIGKGALCLDMTPEFSTMLALLT